MNEKCAVCQCEFELEWYSWFNNYGVAICDDCDEWLRTLERDDNIEDEKE